MSARPPRWAYALLRRSLAESSARESILGDLHEEYATRDTGVQRDLWYMIAAVRMAAGYRFGWNGADATGRRPTFDGVRQDARHAVRSLRRNPGYAITAVITLTVGIGASTAAFSILHGSLLQPLPYRDPEQVVRLYGWWKTRSTDSHNSMSAANFADLRRRSSSFSSLAGYQNWWFNLSVGVADPDPEVGAARVSGLRAEPELLHLLGIPPQLGRHLVAEDAVAGAPGVVVIGDSLWRSRFGADPSIVGKTIRLDLVERTVVGVMDPTFAFLRDPQVIVPIDLEGPDFPRRRQRTIDGMGRMHDGVTLDAALAEAQSIYAELEREYPDDNENWSVTGVGEREWRVRRGRGQLAMLGGAVALVLLIACVNVAGLMLVRAEVRQHEFGVRLALGAGRLRLARLFLTESLLLSLSGAVLGALLCRWLVDLAVRSYAASIPRADEIIVDLRVLGFAVACAVVTALVIAVVPMMSLRAGGASLTLRRSSQAGSRGTAPLRNALVVAELALAVVLVTGAGLMINSVWRLYSVDLGVAEDKVLTFALGLPAARYASAADMNEFWDRFVDEMEALPGIEDAGLISRRPLSGGTNGTVLLADEVDSDPTADQLVEIRIVSADYFTAAGIPLLAGRTLIPADRRAGGGVLVNRAFVERRLGDRDPLAESLHPTWLSVEWPIVGVVADTHDFGPMQEARPTAYWLVGSEPIGVNAYLYAALRTEGDARRVLPVVVERMRALDADIPLVDIATIDEIAAASIGGNRRSSLSLLSIFAGVALLLGAIGTYGVVAFMVSRRTREIGVRMALGSTGSGVVRLVLRQGVVLAIAGLGLGLLASLFASRLLASMLYEVAPTDPATHIGVGLVLLAVTLLACWLPARRASQVEVVEALRRE